jgi:hypothetical protein
MDEAVRKRLLEPMTDEQAESLRLVGREEIDEALRKIDRALGLRRGSRRIVDDR